ncbi:MAG: hypothetical protein ACK5JT_04545 [Hyphomicrobiaceae bacterium]
MHTILRIWFLVTGLVVAALMIWAFVPVLVPVIGLTVAIGSVAAIIVWGARYLERARGGPREPRS